MRRTHRRRPHDKAELALLRSAVAAAGDIAYAWNLKTDRITWSGRVTDIFGLRGGEAVVTGAAFRRRVNADDFLLRKRVLERHIRNGEPFDCEYRVRLDTGEDCWVHERGSVELSRSGKPVRLAGTLRVVTARKENEARLEQQANYDDLTGHFSRLRLREALDQAASYALRYRSEGAYFAVGIDNLTVISEAFGCETADAVILAVGQRLDRHMRASDIIGRTGTDGFGVIAASCPPSDARVVGEKILDAIRHSPVDTPQGRVHVAPSVGCVSFPRHARGAHDIMAKAEVALAEARQAAGGSYACYRSTDADRRDRRNDVAVADRVQEALKRGRLVFAYQPIVVADTRHVAQYECLLRMVDADGRIHAASQFMPIIEKLGLIRQVDHYVLERAARELTEHPDVTLAVNVSGLTASDRSWLRLLAALTRGTGDIAGRLVIEITETVALQDIDESAAFVATIRDLGCRVALDDFGAGYTSFRHLKALAVDEVKIDGSFVRGAARDLDNQLFIKTLLGLAQGFNLSTVAECVETAEDAAMLARLGVNLLQGYYFGRPSIERPWAAGGAARVARPAAAAAF